MFAMWFDVCLVVWCLLCGLLYGFMLALWFDACFFVVLCLIRGLMFAMCVNVCYVV